MNKMLITFAFMAAGAVIAPSYSAFAADKPPDISKLPPASNQTGLTFEDDIKKIIEVSCLKCHSGKRPKSRFEVATRETFIKGGESGKPAIIPGKSAESPVIHYVADLVEEMEMPPLDYRDDYPALSKEQIATLRAWIDQGAK